MPPLVALTGATGFIGSALLTTLEKSAGRLRALTRRLRTGNGTVEWITGDLDSPRALEKLVDGADVIIHCAGIVRGKSADEFLAVNRDGTARLVAACARQLRQRRFLLISSLAARAPALSWYACSKYQAEQALMASDSDMACTAFRPTAVYGPGDRELRPLLKAMKSGLLPVPQTASRFSLLHINDLVRAIMCWVNLSGPISGIYELDDGKANGYNWTTLIELAGQIWGKSVLKIPIPLTLLNMLATTNLGLARLFRYAPMLTPGKVREIACPDWTCDNTDISRKLNWQPTIQLADAMSNPALLQL